MTNKFAIKVLTELRGYGDKFANIGFDRKEAIDLAIKALETQSCDCVSRKDVIILIDKATELHPYKVIGDSETYSNYNQGWEDACNWLYTHVESDNLKTVTPQRKVGKWIRQTDDYYDYYECEQCGIAVGLDDIKNYCPNCGAKMEVDE